MHDTWGSRLFGSTMASCRKTWFGKKVFQWRNFGYLDSSLSSAQKIENWSSLPCWSATFRHHFLESSNPFVLRSSGKGSPWNSFLDQYASLYILENCNQYFLPSNSYEKFPLSFFRLCRTFRFAKLVGIASPGKALSLPTSDIQHRWPSFCKNIFSQLSCQQPNIKILPTPERPVRDCCPWTVRLYIRKISRQQPLTVHRLGWEQKLVKLVLHRYSDQKLYLEKRCFEKQILGHFYTKNRNGLFANHRYRGLKFKSL